jgi:hypothetical protein
VIFFALVIHLEVTATKTQTVFARNTIINRRILFVFMSVVLLWYNLDNIILNTTSLEMLHWFFVFKWKHTASVKEDGQPWAKNILHLHSEFRTVMFVAVQLYTISVLQQHVYVILPLGDASDYFICYWVTFYVLIQCIWNFNFLLFIHWPENAQNFTYEIFIYNYSVCAFQNTQVPGYFVHRPGLEMLRHHFKQFENEDKTSLKKIIN